MNEDQLTRCFGEGIVYGLEIEKTDERYWYYWCPFCSQAFPHYAVVRNDSGLDCRPIICLFTNRQGWVVTNIKLVLFNEESKFRKIIEQIPEGTLDAKAAVKLWQEKGIPLEVLRESVDFPDLLDRLAEEHRRKAVGNFANIYD